MDSKPGVPFGCPEVKTKQLTNAGYQLPILNSFIDPDSGQM